MIVTRHACERFVERVDPCASLAQADAAIRLSERAVTIAATIGCRIVRLGCGAKLVLCRDTVVTVLARGSMFSGHYGDRVQ
jgi:hypothetical protein